MKRKLALQYADARRLRREAVLNGWLNTASAMTDYIACLRQLWRTV